MSEKEKKQKIRINLSLTEKNTSLILISLDCYLDSFNQYRDSPRLSEKNLEELNKSIEKIQERITDSFERQRMRKRK